MIKRRVKQRRDTLYGDGVELRYQDVRAIDTQTLLVIVCHYRISRYKTIDELLRSPKILLPRTLLEIRRLKEDI